MARSLWTAADCVSTFGRAACKKAAAIAVVDDLPSRLMSPFEDSPDCEWGRFLSVRVPALGRE